MIPVSENAHLIKNTGYVLGRNFAILESSPVDACLNSIVPFLYFGSVLLNPSTRSCATAALYTCECFVLILEVVTVLKVFDCETCVQSNLQDD